ncbi:uncharacterized protein LOC105696791 isoform X2 [Orussus abietinus]|uniref:uncharacterized protein LOC105696791 isoform X2 n=1 Tax=Orussus abietinus TaxID=222816 RepID=UPI000625A5E2|nr:uncharacterized protein LOC105696791 isoform X2 [Orussus abietinus]
MGKAILLLTVLLGTGISVNSAEVETTTQIAQPTTPEVEPKAINRVGYSPQQQPSNATTTTSTTTTTERPSKDVVNELISAAYMKPIFNPKDILLQEIRSLDEEASSEKEEMAEAIKAEAQKFKYHRPSTSANSNSPKGKSRGNSTFLTSTSFTTSESHALKELLKAEDATLNDGPTEAGDADDEDADDEDDEDDEYNDDDEDEDEDEDEEDEMDDEEDVMTQCPDYCRCSGLFAAATTAKCSRLVEGQNFGPGIAHLRVENAAEVRLGPHAFQERDLQQLESILFVDTRISELDRTSFDGLRYLFAVNMTRNALLDLHPDTFQNNTELSFLTISGNPLRYFQIKGKDYLLDAPRVAELDFSNNGLPRLRRTAFVKMPNLVYINLRNNQIKTVEKAIFDPLDSLMELDLSDNQLSVIPPDLFEDKGVQTLKVAGNNLTTLATIRATKLTTLDAARNRIKVLAKEDLIGVPSLDQLILASNGLKRIHQHAFVDLSQLTYLDVSDNKLTSLMEHHLRANPRLQILLMNDNPGLESLPVFRTTAQEYETFSVYRLECSNCGLYSLKEGTFNAMPALTRLILSKNRLSSLPKGLLEPLSSLRELDLSDNAIRVLATDTFRGATSLSKLNLAGNALVTLQVSPFLFTPGLSRLDVSRCSLERVWSEARVPLRSLRFLSVRGNRLRRFTVEELRATPKLSGLDMSHNPFNCDEDFNQAIEWLMEHNVTPAESVKYANDFGNADDYSEGEGINQWSDLAKMVCENADAGPPPRPIPHKTKDFPHIVVDFDISRQSNQLLEDDIDGSQLDHGQGHDDEAEGAWTAEDQKEYEDYSTLGPTEEYRPWYGGAMWSVITVILITLAVLLMASHIAVRMARRKGRGPVIRTPMILRQGLIDNKNCGLVYKPLQEEIPTPRMPKRGSFYSVGTFHYDKIVPESV